MNPQELASAFLALDPAGRRAFAIAAGLTSSAHAGPRRCKSPVHGPTRDMVYASTGFLCYWCQGDLAELGGSLDHVTRHRSGRPVCTMVVAACPGCNRARSEMKDHDAVRSAMVATDLLNRPASFWLRARLLRDSDAGKARLARIKARSGGKPVGPADDGFPF